MTHFLFLAGGSERDLLALAVQPLEKFAHFRERPDVGQILLLENLAAILIGFFTEFAQLALVQKHRQILVAAFSNLEANVIELEGVAPVVLIGGFLGSLGSYSALCILKNFDMQCENCVAAWFPAMVHSLPAWMALLCLAIDWKQRAARKGDWFALGWVGLGAVFLWMSFDEMASMHERIGELKSLNPFHHGTEQLGYVYILSVPIALVALFMIGFGWVKVWHRSRLAFFLIGFGIFLYATKPIHEKLEMSMWAAAGWAEDWARPPYLLIIEEATKIFGGLFAALGMAFYAMACFPDREKRPDEETLWLPLRPVITWLLPLLAIGGVLLVAIRMSVIEISDDFGNPGNWFPSILAFLVAALLARKSVLARPGFSGWGYGFAALFVLWLSCYWGADLFIFDKVGRWDWVRKGIYAAMYLASLGSAWILARDSRSRGAGLAGAAAMLAVLFALLRERPHSPDIGYAAMAVLLLSVVCSLAVEPSDKTGRS